MSSPRGWGPTVKIRSLSLLAAGEEKSRGPLVSWMGFLSRDHQDDFSGSAQTLVRPSRKLWKRKYLPSAVQAPQYSRGSLFHAGSKGCKLEPSDCNSQIALEPLRVSTTSKRNLWPSRETRRSMT